MAVVAIAQQQQQQPLIEQLHMHPDGAAHSLFDIEPTLAFAHGARTYRSVPSAARRSFFLVRSYDCNDALVCTTTMHNGTSGDKAAVPWGVETLYAPTHADSPHPLVLGRRSYVAGVLHGREEYYAPIVPSATSNKQQQRVRGSNGTNNNAPKTRIVAVYNWHHGCAHGEHLTYDAVSGALTSYMHMRRGCAHGWAYVAVPTEQLWFLSLYDRGTLQHTRQLRTPYTMQQLRALHADPS